MKEKCKIFVYGTLKKEHPNNCVLGGYPHKRMLGPCTIRGVMFSVNGVYPAIAIDPHLPNTSFVHGEVWEIDEDQLKHVDAYEGGGSMYQREEIDTLHGRAWVYTQKIEKLAARGWQVVTNGWWPVGEQPMLGVAPVKLKETETILTTDFLSIEAA
jgi:gamma-glutamylcyclotransferase (GGCT)/AIG2-like uncharacterized protein YtfP